MCNNEENIIIQSDFECIGDVARHCDLQKLCIATGEAQQFDMSELFCDMWDYILTVNNQVDLYDALYSAHLLSPTVIPAPIIPLKYLLNKNLICGGTYIGCNDKQRKHLGIKRILTYYSYSRYLILNGFSDTASGNMRKTNEFSIPTPLKEVQAFADKYRTMGYDTFKNTLSFLCANKETFTDFDASKCISCGCGGSCESKTKAKGYGFKSSVISKKI